MSKSRRVFIVGKVDVPTSLEAHLVRGLQTLAVPAVPVLLPRTWISTVPKVRRLMTRGSVGVGRRVRELLAEHGPQDADLVVVVKAPAIMRSSRAVAEVLDSWPGSSCLLAPDALASFCTDTALAAWCERGGCIATFDPSTEASRRPGIARSLVDFQFAYDPTMHWRPIDGLQQSTSEVTFVGSWDRDRERTIRLLEPDVPVAVRGSGWSRATTLRFARVTEGNAYGEELAEIVARSAVSLNLLRPQNVRSTNMRMFELPAQGGIAFNFGSEREFLRNQVSSRQIDVLRAQILQHLSLSREQRIEFARSAQDEVRPHTYASRMQDLLAHFR